MFAGIKAITQQLKNRNYENVVKRSETFARQNMRGSQAGIAAIKISNKQTKPQLAAYQVQQLLEHLAGVLAE